MEIIGTQAIPAPREVVWKALNDPDVLKQCLPGCESVVLTSPDEFRVVVVTAIGPLRARFNGVLHITEANPPQSCVMVFEGQGGVVGFGKGSSSVTLRETSEGTELDYSAKAHVGGKLAQVGSRLIDSVAKKMTDDFFKAFRKQLAQDTDVGVAAAATAPEPTRPGLDAAATTPVPGAMPAKPLLGSAAILPWSPATGINPILVPGWWLAVATILGSALTIAGALLLR